MLDKSQKSQEMFNTLKAMFPQLDLSIINPNLPFSQNLQNVVSQLNIPSVNHTNSQIYHMKQVVDRQQLKIQTSLVNEQDILGDVTNRAIKRSNRTKESIIVQCIEQQDSNFWQNKENAGQDQDKGHKHNAGHQSQNIGNGNNEDLGVSYDLVYDLMEDIWQLGNESNKDWFQH